MNLCDRLSGLTEYGSVWILWLLVALSILASTVAIERGVLFFSSRDDVLSLRRRVRRRTRYAYLLPIAATFVTASACGAASGKAQLVWASIQRIAHPGAPAEAPTTPGLRRAIGPMAAAQPVTMPVPALIPEMSSRHSFAPASSVAHWVDAPASAAAKPQDIADPTLALYCVAHTAHFVDHDPARALAGWDAYLAAAPNGTFAPEARYNRALSLVRLGRNGEARSAVQPFASGAYGSYRQGEASALLERIGP